MFLKGVGTVNTGFEGMLLFYEEIESLNSKNKEKLTTQVYFQIRPFLVRNFGPLAKIKSPNLIVYLQMVCSHSMKKLNP